jgi:hypothetical protein
VFFVIIQSLTRLYRWGSQIKQGVQCISQVWHTRLSCSILAVFDYSGSRLINQIFGYALTRNHFRFCELSLRYEKKFQPQVFVRWNGSYVKNLKTQSTLSDVFTTENTILSYLRWLALPIGDQYQ